MINRNVLFFIFSVFVISASDYYNFASLEMLVVFSTLFLPGRKVAMVTAGAMGIITVGIGIMKLDQVEYESLISERIFILLSVALTLALVLWLKKSRAEVESQKSLFEHLFDQSPVFTAMIELESSKIIKVNRLGASMFDATPEEMIGIDIATLYKIQKGEAEIRQLIEEFKIQRYYADERELVSLKGRIFWGRAQYTLFELHGKPITLAYITDIDSLKRAERERIETSLQLAIVFDQISEGIILADMHGTIMQANKAAGRMFRYKPEELIGSPIEKLIPDRFVSRHIVHRENFAHEPRTRRMGDGFDLFARRRDDSEFRVAVSLSPLEFDHNKFVAVFILDTTEQKEYEESLLTQKAELEHLTTRLRASNTELENFAYVSSHDLQEPLRKILAFSEMLQSTEQNRLSPDGLSLLARIQNGATRMQTLISDLLAFSRLNTRPPEFQSLNLRKILNEVLADLDFSIRETGAEIKIGTLPEMMDADPVLIRQLFQNLLSNAIKFRREDMSPLIEIFSQKTENQPLLEIHVRDNGIGFEEKYLSKIFTIFKRLGGAQYPGTGIGLAICKKIAEHHGGSITAISAPGKGAEFIVTLRYTAPISK